MKFKKKRPSRMGYYWYKKEQCYAPIIGLLSKYYDNTGWFVIPFGYHDFDEKKVTGKELWGNKIKEP